MAIDKAVFATEFQRVQYIGSMLTGDAYDLVREALDTIVTVPETPADWEWESATALFEFLDTQYATQDLDRSAGQKFDLLQMTNKPYQNFIAEFEKLAQLAGKTPEQKVAALRMKVSREIMAVIMYRPNKPKKNQWPEWRTFCQEIYDDLEDDKHYTKLRNRDLRQPQNAQAAGPAQTTSPTYASPAQPQPSTQAGDDPMQLDKVDSLGGPGAAARREYRRLHNLCFYCGGAHAVRDCEEKKQNDAKFRRPTQPTSFRGRGGMRGGYGRSTYYQPNQPAPHQAYQPAQQTPQHPPQYQYQPQQPPR